MSFVCQGDVGSDCSSNHGGHIRKIDFRRMKWIKHLDSGGMAHISLYSLNQPGFPSLVAKKSLFSGSEAHRFRKQLRSEINILARLEHENIVKTWGIVETEHDFGLVLEFLPFGSYKSFFGILWDKVRRTQDLVRISVPLKIRMLDEIAKAMKYLHGIRPKRVLHLDLKSDNVLLEQNLHAKITDFGLSRMTTPTLSYRTTTKLVTGGTACGTPGYISPERLQDFTSTPTTKSDVYSFGILAWEIVTDRIPYEGKCGNDFRLTHQVIYNNLRPDLDAVPDIVKKDVPQLVVLIKKCWSRNPSDRPRFEDIHKDLTDLKTGMKEFRLQATTSAERVLTLWRSISDTTESSTTFMSTCEPGSKSFENCRTIATRHDKTIGNGESSRSMSAAPTVPKRLAFTSTAAETECRLSEREDHKEPPDYYTHDETQPLIPRYEVEGNCSSSWKRKLLVLLPLSMCVVCGMVLWLWLTTTQQGDNKTDCPSLKPPLHGSIKCVKATETINAKCVFTCEEKYRLVGKSEINCIDGKWSDKPPVCEPVCPDFKPVEFGSFQCTNGSFVNSVCAFKCKDNHEIKGESVLTCQSTRQWSFPEPTCVCQTCFIGEKCQYSISWKNVAQTLDSMQPYGSVTVQYGERSFVCSSAQYSVIFFSGMCTDRKTGNRTSCSEYNRQNEAEKHAAAELIRNLVLQKQYPEPCDSQDMETGCG